LKEKSVLIVDDEKSIRLTLAMALEKLEVPVDQAENGEEALAMLAKKPYGLMLLDLRMPGVDGMEVLRRVSNVRPELRVVIITAYGSVDTAVEAMKLGAVDFLEKPFHAEDVRQLVATLLDQETQGKYAGREYDKYLELALKRITTGEFDAARIYIHKALSLDSERPESFNLLGGLSEARGQQLEAQKNYRAALALDSSYQPAQKNLERVTTRPYTPLGIDWGLPTGKEKGN
jgi:FixJ family two-component response regulator